MQGPFELGTSFEHRGMGFENGVSSFAKASEFAVASDFAEASSDDSEERSFLDPPLKPGNDEYATLDAVSC